MAQRTRKGRRRTHKPTSIDNELATLASVLAEYQLDNTAHGWFRPPWRDGLNAARLALGVADKIRVGVTYEGDLNELSKLINYLIESDIIGVAVYELAGEIYKRLTVERSNTWTAQLIAAAARCVQLRIANSHGGGAVYNELLIPVFIPLRVEDVADLVLECRCIDAIGVSHHLAGDRNDRQRSAFTIAWRRGLYLAAYSLPPAC